MSCARRPRTVGDVSERYFEPPPDATVPNGTDGRPKPAAPQPEPAAPPVPNGTPDTGIQLEVMTARKLVALPHPDNSDGLPRPRARPRPPHHRRRPHRRRKDDVRAAHDPRRRSSTKSSSAGRAPAPSASSSSTSSRGSRSIKRRLREAGLDQSDKRRLSPRPGRPHPRQEPTPTRRHR